MTCDRLQIGLISLWQIEGKPPWGHKNACSTELEKFMPQTQCVGVPGGGQPYWRERASTKAPLCRLKPNSVIGSDVSQLEV